MAVSERVRADLIQTAAIVPVMAQRIDDGRTVRRIVMQLSGAGVPREDLNGAGQRAEGDRIEIIDPRDLVPTPLEAGLDRYLLPESLIESDAPEIVAEADAAIRGASDPRVKAERLTRHVNALLEKKPTVSIPSAKEVLRTKIGDCNEHTALYVAMARAAGLPARIAVGLVYLHGAFFYHAWPEVYIADGARGLWLPVDPTLNQFPADATHLRIARGGLDKQTVVLPLIGRLNIAVIELELQPGAIPILIGDPGSSATPVPLETPVRDGCGCWSAR
jgi:transglutaminase-like putative cysteine protease